MNKQYYIVPPHIVAAHQGRHEGDKGLYFVQDLQGRYVVGTEVATLWPDIEWHEMETVELTLNDFPGPENTDDNE